MSVLHLQKKKTDDKVDNQEKVFSFLSGHKTGVLATVDSNYSPHAAVLYYSVDDSLGIRFVTKRRTKKSENLENNPRAAIVVYDEALQTTVQITGTVDEVDDEGQSNEAFRVSLKSSLQTAQSAIPPISRLDAGEHVTYRLIPAEIKMTIFKRQNSKVAGSSLEIIDLPLPISAA